MFNEQYDQDKLLYWISIFSDVLQHKRGKPRPLSLSVRSQSPRYVNARWRCCVVAAVLQSSSQIRNFVLLPFKNSEQVGILTFSFCSCNSKKTYCSHFYCSCENSECCTLSKPGNIYSVKINMVILLKNKTKQNSCRQVNSFIFKSANRSSCFQERRKWLAIGRRNEKRSRRRKTIVWRGSFQRRI